MRIPSLAALATLCWLLDGLAWGQTLEEQLRREAPEALAAAALREGDARRGAIVFHQPQLVCTRCHAVDGAENRLGPDLTRLPDPRPTDAQVVEAILQPSARIRQGYEAVAIALEDGSSLTGVVAAETAEQLTLQDLEQLGRSVTIDKREIVRRTAGKSSPMPAGLANQLASRQQFLDLVRYVVAVRDGGLAEARALQPHPSLYALRLPEYESHVDHAGLLRDLNAESLERGRAIYERLCINCHGTPERPGSLPNSLRFATGRFKNGADPHTIYQTLTRGFGLMAPQTWMVPQQKYDVIHYLRETYLRERNPTQYVPITEEYLASLPRGDTRGPAPRTIEPWVTMDYGPRLINTYEVGSDGGNFAQKGIAVRLDDGAGGVSRGRAWMLFDHDTMRVAAAWTGAGFIDWNGIHFNGRHQVHPRLVGDLRLSNPTGPGWADPSSGSFADDQRVLGRDDRRYGPLPRRWARYRGLYDIPVGGDDERRTIIAYTIGETAVWELPGLAPASVRLGGQAAGSSEPTNEAATRNEASLFTRDLELGPRPTPLRLLVATAPNEAPLVTRAGHVVWGDLSDRPTATASDQAPLEFTGSNHLELPQPRGLDGSGQDFTLAARVRTRAGGTLVALAPSGDAPWAPNGQAWFVRDGRLCYDIGWVGVVSSRRRVDDGEWHDVALRWSKDSGRAELFVDGVLDGARELRTKGKLEEAVLRVGFASPNFPARSPFQGELRDLRIYSRALDDDALQALRSRRPLVAGAAEADLVAAWPLTELIQGEARDGSGQGRHLVQRSAGATPAREALVAGVTTAVATAAGVAPFRWSAEGRSLRLDIPAGDAPLRLRVWWASVADAAEVELVAERARSLPPPAELTTAIAVASNQPRERGGLRDTRRWPEALVTRPERGDDSGPFATDVLTPPDENPWLAQFRPTGLDFYSDGDRMAVCTWDGDVWVVAGLSTLDVAGGEPRLTWRRIAAGLFQPLGLKIIDDTIYLTCRDQLAILRDLDGDGETDFYECLNQDHQVTEHFHEFAMGLQVDEAGNFYYAKSARHALPAVVPHHGTLLRVSPDGSRTDIVATGFRAANGVCLNGDGTFVVTDQEGHWNPKNRINWVRPGGFYGNMFGYHDVTDSSDSAMQPPLCWITNAFDRSPAELLWVPSGRWGSLGGSLLNLSYGYGKLYVVPFEEVQGLKQGGLCELPLPALPTGVMRGRFHPQDGQLYTCGMFAWAGSATQPGGVYRIRHTGHPATVPTGLEARAQELTLKFSDPLDASSASDPANYSVKVWSLRRTANYGSEHHDEHPLEVVAARVEPDGRTVRLAIPELAPTWGMEVVCRLRDPDGRPVVRVLHNTIHHLAPRR